MSAAWAQARRGEPPPDKLRALVIWIVNRPEQRLSIDLTSTESSCRRFSSDVQLISRPLCNLRVISLPVPQACLTSVGLWRHSANPTSRGEPSDFEGTPVSVADAPDRWSSGTGSFNIIRQMAVLQKGRLHREPTLRFHPSGTSVEVEPFVRGLAMIRFPEARTRASAV